MKNYLAPLFCSVLLLASWAAVANAQTGAAAHVAKAKAAAYEPGRDFTYVFDALCQEPRRGAAPAQPVAAPAAVRTIPPRSEWYVEPAKVFDNLYFVGSREDSAWAVKTSEGIILIDTTQDYTAEAEIADGLKKLGLDPTQIKYAVVSHAHGDRYAGAKFLQER